MIAERTNYKGSECLKLKRSEDDKYPFSFGYGKAKLILEHIDDIRAFVQEMDEAKEKESD